MHHTLSVANEVYKAQEWEIVNEGPILDQSGVIAHRLEVSLLPEIDERLGVPAVRHVLPILIVFSVF